MHFRFLYPFVASETVFHKKYSSLVLDRKQRSLSRGLPGVTMIFHPLQDNRQLLFLFQPAKVLEKFKQNTCWENDITKDKAVF